MTTYNNLTQAKKYVLREQVKKDGKALFYIHQAMHTGASLVHQYPITLVHIVGFKIIKNSTNILQVLGDKGFKVGVGRVVYKD